MCVCVCVCGVWGCPLIFSHIRRLGPFWGSKILNFNVFFWVRRCCGYFFGVITKLDWFLRLFLCILGSFLEVNVQNGDIFWGQLEF